MPRARHNIWQLVPAGQSTHPSWWPAALCILSVLLATASASAEDSALGDRTTVWERADIEDHRPALDKFTSDYIRFISENKTEREVVAAATAMLTKAGFADFDGKGRAAPGARLLRSSRGKILAAIVVGKKPVSQGVRVIAAHIDAVRLDLKQNALWEDGNLALVDTHYYGGIKRYQWLSRPLELRGTVVLEGGKKIDVRIGDEPDEPILVVPDLLAHLSRHVDDREGEDVPAEDLDAVAGSIPSADSDTVPANVRDRLLSILESEHGFAEEDMVAAELQLVPAGPARLVGLDRSMIGGYGHDDRACGFAALRALMETKAPEHTAIVLLLDKEEIGSTGNTGARSEFIADVVGSLLAAQGRFDEQQLRRAFRRSMALSTDVTSAANPLYPDVYSARNVALLGSGPVLDQTGNHAEFIEAVVRALDKDNVTFQTGEFSRVFGSKSEEGTVLPYLTQLGMDGMELSLPLLSMHAPFEVISSGDLYFSYLAYQAFFGNT